ncbi:MAG: sulfotransferase [Methylohalobius crimeensis]
MNQTTVSENPFFIVGAPRSGTTLLQYMLRSHRNLSLPTGESHFFVPLYRNRDKFGDLGTKANIRRVLEVMYRQSAEFLDTDLHGIRFDIERLTDDFHREGRDTIPLILSGLYEKNAAGEGKRRWGEKTPYYVLQMPLILEMFPGARFIHLIRDGRDVLLSLFGRRDDFGVYNSYYGAKYWEYYVATGQHLGRQLGPAQYLEIRYEDLVRDPGPVVRRILDFLEEPFDPAVINFRKSGEPGKTPLLQRGLQSDNLGKWRKKLNRRQLLLFEGAAGTLLYVNGYSLTTHARPTPFPIRIASRFHNAWVRKYRRWLTRCYTHHQTTSA